MENITFRTNFFDKVKVDSINQRDLGSLDFGDFDFGENLWYRCTAQDVGRPDLISYKIYGTTNFWWFIMWYNGVEDVWNDIHEMMWLKYPSVAKVKDALRKWHKKD